MSEFLGGSVGEAARESLGLTEVFVGVIIIIAILFFFLPEACTRVERKVPYGEPERDQPNQLRAKSAQTRAMKAHSRHGKSHRRIAQGGVSVWPP